MRKERKTEKQLIKHLVITLLIFTLISALIMIVPVVVGSDDSGQSEIIADLEDLHEHVSNTTKLPNNAFNNSRAAEGQRNALCNKIQAVIHQIEAGAYKGAVNKLQNDIENAISNWINDPWKSKLIEEVEDIIEKIRDKEPPVIVDVWREPETPAYNETVKVKANVTDEKSGVEIVILSYSIDRIEWVNVTMELVEGLYVGEIPAFPYDTTVYYKIYAYDKAGNLATAGTYSYTVADPYDPVIGVPTWEPEEPFADEEVKVSVSVSEPANASGIKNVTLSYRTDGEWQSLEMELKNGKWTATIPGQSAGVNVTFYIESYDNAGNSAMTPTYYYTVKAPPPGRRPVATFTYSPLTPYTDEAVNFDARASYDPDGYVVSYLWDFGDDATGTGNITTHSYADNGIYTVTLKVTDNDRLWNTFSADVTVLNRAPVAVFTESAETVNTGEDIYFNATDSYDPDGTISSYFWDFGDNTTEIYKGENLTAIATHTYAEARNYTVTLRVTDDDGASSSFSAEKTVKARPGLMWALFAAVGLGIAALVATAIYLWYRRRKKRGAASAAASPSRPETKPVVTLYVPSGILAGYQEERR